MVELAGEHPDRQRQVPAQPGDLTHPGVTGGQARAAGQAGQQLGGLIRGQGVQADHRGVFQRGQPPPAGDQHQAPGGAGQQRPDLLMPGRVVQHQQHLLARQVIPPPGCPGLQARRDLPGADPGGQQQAGQRIGGIHRPLPRGVRVQRQEQLPVRETVGEPVRRVHRQGGLADPGHPADRADPHHPPARRRARQVPQQLPELGAAAGEAGDITRQRPGYRRGGRRRDLLAQHRLLQLAQFLPRLDPQFLRQHRPGAAVGGQRIGLPLGPVQRQHQQPPQPLPHRVLGHQLLQLAGHLRRQPQLNVRLDAALHRHQPKLLQPRGLQRQRLHLGHIGQRPAPPQRQRLPEPAGRDRRLAPAQRVPARPHQPLKPARVQPIGLAP